ncbi:ATP-binding cassette domain-containing protein [Lactococcus nasutitermitis]|uniref:ATP-binding cassette domain-containing protein n=1 Tax=Lactococcus nasutitermitis TaxID=1652957 RepID=A0ABV9JF51_9LACT|nr:ATP-binding cassette domain-containing protein [Lactococcus nasutitermitis]
MVENMITVNHLQKNFKKTLKQSGLTGSVKSLFHPQFEIFEAVKDLTFEVPKGEILGFIGPNGAGKSTTIKMLTGILTPTSGFCEINGKIPQKDRKNYVKDIGVVFGQRTQLWWDLPLQETYGVLKEIYKVPDTSFNKRMAFLNEVLDLQDFIKDPVRTLSLGQRMRADIAASLLHSPKVLFLDEPTIGLDVAVKDNIRQAIQQINAEEQTTIILTTHDLNDIELLSDRIFMIDKGAAIFDGSVKNLKEKYGKTHTLTIELSENVPVKFENISDKAVKITQNDTMVSVKFDSSQITAPELISQALTNAPVKDVSVAGADIEDIIRRFFRKEDLSDAETF